MKPRELRQLFHSSLDASIPHKEVDAIFRLCAMKFEHWTAADIAFNEGESSFDYSDILARLADQEPLQYILGTAHFMGLDLNVRPGVLIPRPETEELVQWILDENPQGSTRVLDIGTGSACIALGLKAHRPEWQVRACDLHTDALEIARENANYLSLSVELLQLDALTDKYPESDILVSNPPYIPASERTEMEERVINFEPEAALFVPDEDPLLFYKAILDQAKGMKAVCYFEIHENMKDEMQVWLEGQRCSFKFRQDLQGKYRMLKVY